MYLTPLVIAVCFRVLCSDFGNISAEKNGQKLAILTQITVIDAEKLP
jgi:hypothetical protein